MVVTAHVSVSTYYEEHVICIRGTEGAREGEYALLVVDGAASVQKSQLSRQVTAPWFQPSGRQAGPWEARERFTASVALCIITINAKGWQPESLNCKEDLPETFKRA